MYHHVYQTTNLLNGNRYIGYHKGELDDSYLGSGTVFLQAVEKYGKENFQKVILFIGETAEEARGIMEPFFIRVRKPEYNIAAGGFGGWTQNARDAGKTPESLAKRGANIKAAFTDERKKEYSARMTGEGNPCFGQPKSEEWKKVVGEKNKAHMVGDRNPMKRPEVREKSIAARKGKPWSAARRAAHIAKQQNKE